MVSQHAGTVPHVALWGSEHPDLGGLVVDALPPATAIGLSAGRLAKPYAHLDDNEDAVLAAEGAAGTLLVVTDGHSGFDAASAALEAIRGQLSRLSDVAQDPLVTVNALLAAARQGVRERLASVTGERRNSRTALSVALLSSDEVLVGGWGDTQVLRVRGRRTKTLSNVESFLDSSAEVVTATPSKLKPGDFIVVCSDGLRDYLVGGWPEGTVRILRMSADPAMAVQGLIEAAWAGGAGDHVSVALSQAS